MEYKQLFEKVIYKKTTNEILNPIGIDLVKDVVRKRKRETHKGDYGRLLIVGGSEGMTGAPCMSAMAALRCGCGLVTVACPGELNPIFEIKLTEAMTLPVTSESGNFGESAWIEIKDAVNSSDCVLIGPGMAVNSNTKCLMENIIKNSQTPLVIDAGGLGAISHNTYILKEASCPVIITPHVGEFSRLSKDCIEDILKDRHKKALEFSKEYGCTVILKSHETVVATPKGDIFTNTLGNPGMATGGSGDVLAGAVASFCSAGTSPVSASLAGVFFHSAAGDMAALKYGEYSLIATDIINCLAYAVKETNEKY